MNRLMIEKKYEQVVELFEEYYKDGFRVDKEAVKSKPEPNKFFFPHDQFSLVTQALLKMVFDHILITGLLFIIGR